MMSRVLWRCCGVAWMPVLFVLAGCAGNAVQTTETRSIADSPATSVSSSAPTGDPRRRAQAHVDLGKAYLQQRRFATALEEVNIALKSDPGFAPAHSLLGAIHVALNERPQALAAYEQAYRLAPKDGDINNDYGWLLCLEGKEEQAQLHFMNAVKNPLYETPTRPFTNAGLCYIRANDYAKALPSLQRAVETDPSNKQAWFLLSESYYRVGNYFAAQQTYRELMRDLDQPMAEVLWLALRVERKIGNTSAEQAYASQLMRKFAGSPEYQKLMQGQYE